MGDCQRTKTNRLRVKLTMFSDLRGAAGSFQVLTDDTSVSETELNGLICELLSGMNNRIATNRVESSAWRPLANVISRRANQPL